MNKRQIFTTVLSVLLSVFLVVGVVIATTTIGLDIANDSTAEAIGISLTGTYSTAAIQIGAASPSQLILTAADDRAINIYTTNDLTSNDVARSVEISHENTGVGAIGEAFRATLTSDVKVGAWGNAIMGKLDFLTDGYVHGMAGAICGELNMPGSAFTHGTYAVFEAELECPANSTGYNNNPVSFMYMTAWGTNVANFQSDGFIFEFGGLGTAATTGNIFQTNTAADATHALKIRIDGVPYYIMLTSVGS